MAATTTIFARVSSEDAAELEALAAENDCDRPTLLKTVLKRSLKTIRMETAVKAYAAQRVTLSKAAEITGISTWDFLALMPAERLDLHYDVAEFEQDLKA